MPRTNYWISNHLTSIFTQVSQFEVTTVLLRKFTHSFFFLLFVLLFYFFTSYLIVSLSQKKYWQECTITDYRNNNKLIFQIISTDCNQFSNIIITLLSSQKCFVLHRTILLSERMLYRVFCKYRCLLRSNKMTDSTFALIPRGANVRNEIFVPLAKQFAKQIELLTNEITSDQMIADKAGTKNATRLSLTFPSIFAILGTLVKHRWVIKMNRASCIDKKIKRFIMKKKKEKKNFSKKE